MDIVTAEEMLLFGLKLVHFSATQIQKSSLKRNTERFKANFRSSPFIGATLWEALVTFGSPDLFPRNLFQRSKSLGEILIGILPILGMHLINIQCSVPRNCLSIQNILEKQLSCLAVLPKDDFAC